VQNSAIVLGLRHFGKTDFLEQQLSVGYGRKLSPFVNIGASVDYTLRKIRGYPAGHSLAGTVSTAIQVHPDIVLLVALRRSWNSQQVKFGIPQRLNIETAFGYSVSRELVVAINLHKGEGSPLRLAAGIRYQFSNALTTSIALDLSAAAWSFGAGLQLKLMRLLVMTAHHPQLGFTPGLQILLSKSVKE
jgi:hypothetical protein